MNSTTSTLILIALVIVYILPTIIAFQRNHNNRVSLAIINLLSGGLSFIISGDSRFILLYFVWTVCLSWAFWNHAPVKAKAADKKKKKNIWPITITILLVGAIALLGINIASNNSTGTLPLQTTTSNVAPDQSGVPMSADDFLNNQ